MIIINHDYIWLYNVELEKKCNYYMTRYKASFIQPHPPYSRVYFRGAEGAFVPPPAPLAISFPYF